MTLANKIVAPVADMLPVIIDTISKGGIAEMTVTGDSMLPTLKDRVSSVRLSKPENLQCGDIVLFQRNNGDIVLHRIVKISNESFSIIGDNQPMPETGIAKAQIIAKVTEYNREGKLWQTESFVYRIFFVVYKSLEYRARYIKRRICAHLRRK